MEIELIVKLAWRNVPVHPINVKVLYDPNERVSHFRPFKDFTRISILNTWFVVLTALYYLPKRLILSLFKKGFWKQLKAGIFQPTESITTKSVSVGFGFFMGIFPIWGFQLLIGIPLAILFRMNKVLFIAAANISIPPCIPFIIAASYYVGGWVVADTGELPAISEMTLQAIHLNFMQYAVGAVLLAALAGVAGFVATWVLLKVSGYKPKPVEEAEVNLL